MKSFSSSGSRFFFYLIRKLQTCIYSEEYVRKKKVERNFLWTTRHLTVVKIIKIGKTTTNGRTKESRTGTFRNVWRLEVEETLIGVTEGGVYHINGLKTRQKTLHTCWYYQNNELSLIFVHLWLIFNHPTNVRSTS